MLLLSGEDVGVLHISSRLAVVVVVRERDINLLAAPAFEF